MNRLACLVGTNADVWGGAMMPRRRQTRLGMDFPPCSRTSRGFSLLELLVVLVITSLLTALLFPGMRAARDSAHKLMCASNMRQLGTGIILYSSDHNDRIPHSKQADRNFRLDQMSLTCRNAQDPSEPDDAVLDGIGLLVGGGSWGYYCDALECLYCPSHTGAHTLDRYKDDLQERRYRLQTPRSAFGNFHYVGYRPDQMRVSFLTDGRLLLTDGFRTQSDFNHETGMNKLYGDGSITWWADADNRFYLSLPPTPVADAAEQTDRFNRLWQLLGVSDRAIGYGE